MNWHLICVIVFGRVAADLWSVGNYFVSAMARKYRAMFDEISKEWENLKKGGRTKNDLDNVSDICKGHGNGAEKSWQRDGDWLCPNTGCRNINFAFRGVCNRCRATRHADASGTGAGNGGRGCGMRHGGRANTTAIGKKDFQTVRVEMSVDDWKSGSSSRGCT